MSRLPRRTPPGPVLARFSLLVTLLVALLVTLLVTGPLGAQGGRKVLRVGVTAPPGTLDPSQALDTVSGLVCSQIFETPYAVLPGSTSTTPRLFATPLRADSPLVFSAPIRPGATFSDGTAVTAALAATSLSRLKGLAERASVTSEGDRVVITLRAPDALLETTLSQTFCGVALRKGTTFLGSGPYMPGPAATLNAMTLVRNPRHAPAAPIDEIRLQVYRPTSDGGVAGLANAVRRGDVDFTDGLPASEAASFEKTPGIVTNVQPGKSTGVLFLQTEKPGPLQDPRVRRAIAQAINAGDLSRRFFGGSPNFAANGLLPPAMATKDSGGLAFDPAAARALLSETKAAGGADLELLETWTARPYAPNPTGICRTIAEQLAKIGLRVRVVAGGGTAGYFGRLEKGDFDMILAGWVADTHEPIDFVEAQMASWSIPNPGNRCGSCNNLSRYRNRNVDAAIRAYRESRKPAALQAAFAAIREDAPFVPVLNGPATVVLSKRIKGWKPSPLSGIAFSAFDLE